jgi:hypothetical protein
MEKGAGGPEKPLVGKELFALGPGAIERSIGPGTYVRKVLGADDYTLI